MRISIVTLNFNGSEETIKLFKSLKEQTPNQRFRMPSADKNRNHGSGQAPNQSKHGTGQAPNQSKHGTGQANTDLEIIVVDNASEEADFATLQTACGQPTSQVGYPQVKVVRNSENLGFSGGNNVGIRQALKNGSDWVVLLNNDTWVERGFIGLLKAALSDSEDIVGIPLNEDRKTAYAGKIQWLKPTLKHVRSVRNDGSVGDEAIPTSKAIQQAKQSNNSNIYTIGGAMAVHKDVFDKIGFLDEKYFLYFEDADFSIRALKAGFEIFIAKNLSVHHHHTSSTTKKLGSPLLLRYHYRNALYFNLKNGPWWVKFLVWPWSVVIVIKQLGKLVIRKNVEQSKAILSGVRDFYKNKMGKIL